MYNESNAIAAKSAAMQNSAGLTAAPQTQSEVAHAAMLLDGTLCRAEARLTELVQRLQPIIQDRPQQAGINGTDKAERQMFSALGRGVMETNNRVEQIERRIIMLLDTIAI